MHPPQPACCWLEATDATEGRGNTDTAPYISANTERRASSSDESPLPSRRTSGGLLEVVGIDSLTIDGVTAIITEDGGGEGGKHIINENYSLSNLQCNVIYRYHFKH